jgi:hypothetical protein
MSSYTSFTKLKHLIFLNGGSSEHYPSERFPLEHGRQRNRGWNAWGTLLGANCQSDKEHCLVFYGGKGHATSMTKVIGHWRLERRKSKFRRRNWIQDQITVQFFLR